MSFFGLFFKGVQSFTWNSNNRDCRDSYSGGHNNWWGHDNKWWDKYRNCDNNPPKDDCGCDDKFTINQNTVIINGTSGNDTIIAGDGNQTVYAGSGDDVVAGRSGNDQLSGGAGNDTMAGDIGTDILCGGDGDDFLLGNRGNDEVYGGKGNDTLYGGEEDDVVCGGYGNDFVSGDEGNDVLFGGSGDDTFYYGPGPGNDLFGKDVIKDFELDGRGRDGDKIEFANLGTQFDTYAEVMSAASQTADGVLFNFGNDRTLLVEDVRMSDLTSDYFVF